MPDILLIVTDDQRPETLRWMNVVPELIAGEGRAFLNGMIPTAACGPSRASLLTGLFAHSTGVWSNGNSDDIPDTGGWRVFHDRGLEDRTIAVALQAAGFRTTLVGKYLNGFDGSPGGYVPPGWSGWHSFAVANGAYFEYTLRHTDGAESTHGAEPEDYSTDVLRDLAIREIRDTPVDVPLFLMFAPYAVHGPTTPALRHAGTGAVGPYLTPSVNEPNVADKPPWIAELPDVPIERVTRQRHRTQETLRSVDEAVAALIDAFADRARDDTLVIYTSDNGHLWGEHRLRGKNMSYEATCRVPLLMRWPAHITPGTSDRRLALNVDVAATIAQAAGVALPDDVDGVPLLGEDLRDGFPLESPVTNGHDGSGQRVARPAYCGFRTRRYAYVRYADGIEELYDYGEDPYELQNVVADPRYAETSTSLRRRAEEECVPTPPGFSW